MIDSVTTGVRRVGFASRSGITDGSGAPPSRLGGLGRLRRRVGGGLAAGRWRGQDVGDRLEERRVEARRPRSTTSSTGRRPRRPGSTVNPRRSSHASSPPAGRYCSRYLPSALLNATTRWLRASNAYRTPLRRLEEPSGRSGRRDHGEVRVGPDRAVLGRIDVPAGGRDDPGDLAVLGDVDVAVDQHVRHLRHVALGGQPRDRARCG